MRILAALLLAIVLGACGPQTANHVLELHCRGERVVDAQPPAQVERVYRIDLEAPVLQDWNFETKRFASWGEGQISTSGSAFTYLGEMRTMNRRIIVRRQVHFDRSTRKVRDQLEASWGSAMAFEGECRQQQ